MNFFHTSKEDWHQRPGISNMPMMAKRPLEVNQEKASAQRRDGTDLWSEAMRIGLPANYWHGRTIQEGFAPDNILIFPYDRKPLASNLGSSHPRFVLDIIMGSPGLLRLDDVNYQLASGDCALIFPHQFNYAPNLTESDPKETAGWIVVTFDLREAAEIESLRHAPRRMQEQDYFRLEKLLQAYHQGEPPVVISYHLTRLLLGLCEAPKIPAGRCNVNSPLPERDELLEKINTFLSKNLNRPLKAAELAKGIGYGEAELKRRFRAITGKNIVQYIRQQRLSEAARRMQRSEGNLTDIAHGLGFSSVYAFSRMFKMAYGLPPKQYEKIILENRLEELPDVGSAKKSPARAQKKQAEGK